MPELLPELSKVNTASPKEVDKTQSQTRNVFHLRVMIRREGMMTYLLGIGITTTQSQGAQVP